MTWKQIETSREVRLWVTQIIVPVLGVATAVMVAVPEARKVAVEKFTETKNWIKCKFHK